MNAHNNNKNNNGDGDDDDKSLLLILIIKKQKIQVLEGLKNGTISIDSFSQSELHPNSGNKRAVDWIFVLDTLNFSFWPRDGDNKWNVNGHTGYFALCSAIKRAVDVSHIVDSTSSQFI